MAGTDITLSAEALDRMQKVTRTRERVRIARLIEERIETLACTDDNSTANALIAFVEELRTEGVPVKVYTPTEIEAINAAEVARVNAIVADEEGDGLPDVRHIDDEEMARSIVNNRVQRGITQGMRD